MLQQLKDLIDSGGDIEFSVCGKKYTILPWTDDGIVIGPYGSNLSIVRRSFRWLFDRWQTAPQTKSQN